MKLHSVSHWVLFGALLGPIAAGQVSAQSFTVTPTLTSVTIHPGDQNIPINVSVTDNGNTYSGPIAITVTGLPSGVSASPLTLTSGSSADNIPHASVSADQEDFLLHSDAGRQPSRTLVLIGAVGAEQSTAQLILTVSISNSSFAPSPSAINLPIVTINTNQTPIVNKTTDVPGTITITSADGLTAYLPSPRIPTIQRPFSLHGNSTLLMPQLSYHVKIEYEPRFVERDAG